MTNAFTAAEVRLPTGSQPQPPRLLTPILIPEQPSSNSCTSCPEPSQEFNVNKLQHRPVEVDNPLSSNRVTTKYNFFVDFLLAGADGCRAEHEAVSTGVTSITLSAGHQLLL